MSIGDCMYAHVAKSPTNNSSDRCIKHLRQEAESPVCSLARNGVDGTLDVLAPVQLLVQTHQNEAQNGRADGGQTEHGAVYGEGDDWKVKISTPKHIHASTRLERIKEGMPGGTHHSLAG